MSGDMDMDMDIVPRDRLPHVNDLPPELLDAIFRQLRPPPTLFAAVGPKHDLCAAVLVCRLWRSIALDHLFSDVSFGVAEFTDSTVWKGKLAREPLDKRRILSPAGREVAIHGLVTVHGFLKRKSQICGIVRRLTLHRALQYFPSWDDGLVRIDLNLFQALIELLPRLEELVLSRMVIYPPSATNQNDCTPRHLERLSVDYGPAFSDHQHDRAAHTTALLQCFTGLRTLTIDGYSGQLLDTTFPSALAYPSQLRRLELHNAHVGPSFLSDLRQSPCVATLRHFAYTSNVAPLRPVQQALQALLNTLGPNLLSFACTVVEPINIVNNETYRLTPLDLSACTSLERLHLTIPFLGLASSAPRTWLRVAHMLGPLAWPRLHDIGIKIRSDSGHLRFDADVVRPVEDALLELRRANGGRLQIVFDAELVQHTESLYPELLVNAFFTTMIVSWFPRLLDCIVVRDVTAVH